MSVSKRSSFIDPKVRNVICLVLCFFALVALPAELLRRVSASVEPLFPNNASTIFINEFHYDNTGGDVGEFVEIAGPAGTDLTGYSIVLYNGNGGAAYDTFALSGSIPNQLGGYGTVSTLTPGLQNGSPDGIALIGPGSTVVQFLCYEGFFTAVGGAANGVQCTNVVVQENGSENLGMSLQLTGSGTTYGDFMWTGPTAESPGSPNTGQVFGAGGTPTPTPTPTATPSPSPSATPTPGPVADVVINELDSDTPGTDEAEFVELYDGGTGNTALDGLVVVFYNGNGDVSYASFDLDGLSTDADGYFTLGNAAVPGAGIVFSNNTLQNGADAVAVYAGDATSFPNGTAVTTTNLVDAVVYDTADADDAGLLVLLNASEPQVDEAGTGSSADNSIGRCPNGEGGARNTSGFIAFVPTPGAANDCPAPPVPRTIAEIQGNGNVSPFDGTGVITMGVVTGIKTNGFFMQEPDATVDSDPMTSEGIFVFTSSAPAVSVGDAVSVTGTASEFFNLTQISALSGTVMVLNSGNPVPAPVLLDPTILDPNGTPDQLERLEGMRVMAVELRSVSPTNNFGEIFTVLNGVARPFREPGIDVTFQVPNDPTSGVPDCCIPIWDKNPERIMVDTNGLAGSTSIDVTTGVLLSNILGPLDFNFGDYKIDPESPPVVGSPNTAAAPLRDKAAGEFTVGGFNIQNFSNSDSQRHKAAVAIRTILKSPDVLGVIEILNLSSLQALAQQINDDAVANGDPDPGYSAYLIPAPAGGSQNVGFLVKGSVQVDSVTQERGNDYFVHPVTGLPATLHDRPPLVLRATVNPSLDPRGIIVVVNHPRSFIDIEDLGNTGLFVREKRKLQAESIAGLLQELQAGSPGTPVISVGDYNAYEFNDGYTDPVATIKGSPTSDDEVVVDASPDLVDPDFVNLTDTVPADQRYTFIFEGSPQAIDHVFVNPDANSIVQDYKVAHINSDYPGSAEFSDVTRPEKSSDHDATLAYLRFPQRSTTTSVTNQSVVYDISGQEVTLSATVTATVNTVNEGTVTFTVTDESGMTTIGTAGPANVSGGSASANFFLDSSLVPQRLKVRADFSGGTTTLSSYGIGNLDIVYGICPLFNPSGHGRSGAVLPVKIRLCDVNGVNLSDAGIPVTALYLTPANDINDKSDVMSPGRSNPQGQFRYDSDLEGYILILSTGELSPGQYLLHFTAGNDPSVHTVEFTVN